MNEKEELLAKNIKEFYDEGNRTFERRSYNSATSLLFKALAVLSDWLILRKEGFIPKSHTDRFRILQQKHPDIYKRICVIRQSKTGGITNIQSGIISQILFESGIPLMIVRPTGRRPVVYRFIKCSIKIFRLIRKVTEYCRPNKFLGRECLDDNLCNQVS